MVRYQKNEARAWAREHMRGVANVVIPSYTLDLERLNELRNADGLTEEEFTQAKTKLLA